MNAVTNLFARATRRQEPVSAEEEDRRMMDEDASAKAQLNDVREVYGAAILDVDRGVPGAIARRAEAAAALKEAERRVGDVLAKRLAIDAERRERAQQKRDEEDAAADSKLRAVAGSYLEAMTELCEAIPVFTTAWARVSELHAELYALGHVNPRASTNWMQGLDDLVGHEIIRQSVVMPGDNLRTARTPPGTPRGVSPDQFMPLLPKIRTDVEKVLQQLERAASARAKRGVRRK